MRTTGKHGDRFLIRYAHARGQERVEWHEGEGFGAFLVRACRVFELGTIVWLTNAEGGRVAWTDDGMTLHPARLLSPGRRSPGP